MRGPDVTKDALYHHFDGKASLFETVLEAVEQDTQQRILEAYQRESDSWQGATAGLDIFLSACADTDYGRLVFVEGPVALGWGRWREYEQKYGSGSPRGWSSR